MSDTDLVRALDHLEAWLEEITLDPDPAFLAQWNEALPSILAGVERGKDWDAIVRRAAELSQRLEERTEILRVERNRLKEQLDLQALGSRALRGYQSSTS